MFGLFKSNRHFDLDRIPDMTGKVAIVTGANAGIGLICAQELAKKGAHVFLACRTESKTLPVIEEIKKSTGNDKVEFLQLDLLSLQSVKEAAELFKTRNLPLHLLLNNAGIGATPFTLSSEGVESQFATNYLAHYYFTILLLPILESSAPSRVVNVSSAGHKLLGPPDLDLNQLNDESRYGRWLAYGRSKLAVVLFTVELNRRLEAKGVKNVYVNSNDPGNVNTNFMSHIPVLSTIISFTFIPPRDGAVTQMYLATSPEIEEKDIKGKYFVPYAIQTPPSLPAQNPELAVRLWDFTENLLKEKVPNYQGARI